MSFDKLEGKNKFVATYELGNPEVIYIFNTFTGQVLKIKNPRNYHTTYPLAFFIRENGVCTDDGFICRVIAYGHELTQVLPKPKPKEVDRLYDKISDFILLERLGEDEPIRYSRR
jgi:hypothetical protein